MLSSSLVAKLASMAILGGVSLVLGLLPLKLSDHFLRRRSSPAAAEEAGDKDDEEEEEDPIHSFLSGKYETMLSALSCFGAGVILTTALTHMLPEVNNFVSYNVAHGMISDTGLPLAEIFVLCGFFMVYLVEELTHAMALAHRMNKQRQGQGQDGELGSSETFQASLRGFVVMLALSLHAVFEGIALGLSQQAAYVWYLCLAVAAHKFVIAFCIGVQFVRSRLRPLLTVLYVATFCLITPLGIGVGIALTETANTQQELKSTSITVLQGLATGTLIYVVFFEILEQERRGKKSSGLLQAFFVILGFLAMILVQYVESMSSAGNKNVLTSSSSSSQAVVTCVMSEDIGKQLQFPVNISCTDGIAKIL